MSERLRSGQVPTGQNQEDLGHEWSFVSSESLLNKRANLLDHSGDKEGSRHRAAGESDMPQKVEIVYHYMP